MTLAPGWSTEKRRRRAGWLPLAVSQLPALSLRDWLGLAVLGVVFTALAHALFIQPAGVAGTTVAVVTALEPVYGMAFVWLLFAQVPDARIVAGQGDCYAGHLVSTTGKSIQALKLSRKTAF